MKLVHIIFIVITFTFISIIASLNTFTLAQSIGQSNIQSKNSYFAMDSSSQSQPIIINTLPNSQLNSTLLQSLNP